MPLYTFESSNSPVRLQDAILAADTSYLITLSDTNQPFYLPAINFHSAALAKAAGFAINVVVRHEFIRKLRHGFLIDAILRLAASDAAIESRYKTILGTSRPLTAERLASPCETLFKDHVKAGDTASLLAALPLDMWTETRRLEQSASMTYISTPGASWDDLGALLQFTGMIPTDAMIVNFALHIGASAIATTDCDYACISSLIDIYMPLDVARQCSAYDPAND